MQKIGTITVCDNCNPKIIISHTGQNILSNLNDCEKCIHTKVTETFMGYMNASLHK